jgi:hypothetical protein
MFNARFLLCLAFSALTFAEMNHNEKTASQTKLQGFYLGGFGGAGFGSVTNTQQGAALYSASLLPNPYSIDVNAKGTSANRAFGIGGLHFGYQWYASSTKKVFLAPAVEWEGYYYARSIDSFLDNLSTPDDIDFHHFENYLPTRNFGYTANFVLALENDYITPYIAGGFGQQINWVHNAYSDQIEPAEPGINHFNGKTKAHAWSCSVLFKAGLRKTFCTHYRFFGEYRMLYNSRVNFELGPTEYPTHRPTTPWQVGLNSNINNIVALGFDFLW